MADNNRRTRREIQAELRKNNIDYIDESKDENIALNDDIFKEDAFEPLQNKNDYNKINNSNVKKTKKEKPQKKKSAFAFLFLIETILIIWLYYFLGIKIVALLVLIPLIYIFLCKNNKKKGKKRPKGSFLFLSIYVIFIMVGLRVNSVTSNFISSIQINEFYVMALDSDEVNDLSEIDEGSTIAIGPDDSYNTNIFPKEKFAEEGYAFTYTTYNSEEELAVSLLDGMQRFIVVSNPNSDKLSNVDGFSDNTKIIGHYKEKIKIKTNKTNVTRKPFTILLTGVDARVDNIDANSRSDSIMVARVNPKTADVSIVSLPRDSYVLSTCTGANDKLTHSSLNGINCLIDDVENLLDIDIDYYLTVNFFAVIKAIDAVGGIDINIESAFCGQDEYDNPNAYCFNEGMQHLSGAEALSYARERHSFSGGDYARAEHQRQVVTAFIKSLISSGPLAINELLEVLSESARTNMSAKQITSLIKLLQKTDDINVESYTVEGYGSIVDIPYWGLYSTSVQVLDDGSVNEAKEILNSVG